MKSDQTPSVTTAAVGFASGDRIVVNVWNASSGGPFLAVMWAERDNWRTLFVAHQEAADVACLTHQFDAVVVDPTLSCRVTGRQIMVAWAQAQLELTIGRGAVPIPSRSEALAWRSPDLARRIVAGWAIAAGRDLGAIGPPTPACGFVPAEPPPIAALIGSLAELSATVAALGDDRTAGAAL